MGLSVNDVSGIGAVADLAKVIVARVWPDKSAQEQSELAAAVVIAQGQMGIDQAEASSNSLFTSGWRPFIGWACGAACVWNWIGLPAALFLCAYFAHPVTGLAPADVSQMMPLLLGMLGLGGLRTYEKVKGVA